MNEARPLKIGLVLAAMLLFSTLGVGSSRATTMVELSLSELCWISDLIAVAHVEQSRPEKQPGEIYIKTVSTLRLDRVLKGAHIEGDRIQVREWGGSLNGERTALPGAPRYVAGERVLVFLEREQRGSMWRTVGLSQGKLTFIEEADTGRDVVVKLRLPEGLQRFHEEAVKLPAVRRYSEDLVGRVEDDLQLSYVPPYRAIPGLPAAKARAFFDAALATGQQLDPRWRRPQLETAR